MAVQSFLRNLASTVRWRLKLGRWLVKSVNAVTYLPRWIMNPASRQSEPSSVLASLESDGFVKAMSEIDLPQIDLETLRGVALGKAFVDVSDKHPDVVTEMFVRLLGMPDISNTILGYFKGRPWLWNVALNYSDPVNKMSDSQLWHFDYGDVRQLHFMIYFTNVDEACGPFTFLKSRVSDRIIRSPLLIERLTDGDLARKYAINVKLEQVKLLGRKGDVYGADPGRLLHQGARCMRPRLVMFVTFTTPIPMSKGGRSTMSNDFRSHLARAYRSAYPDGVLLDSVFA